MLRSLNSREWRSDLMQNLFLIKVDKNVFSFQYTQLSSTMLSRHIISIEMKTSSLSRIIKSLGAKSGLYGE